MAMQVTTADRGSARCSRNESGNAVEISRPEKLSYTIREAEVALGVGRSTIYKLIGEGRLKVSKVGARTLIPTSELLGLLANSARKQP